MYNYRYASGHASGTTVRSDHPLQNHEIARVAPSVFAAGAHHGRSERYTFVPTVQVLEQLRAEGFEPFEARQTKVRKEGRAPFTRHMLRLRHPDMIQAKDVTPEIILLNSHDGTSSYQLLTGFFRSICDNGLVAGNVHSDIRIHHRGNIGDNVIDGCIRVVENLEAITNRVDEYRGKILSLFDQKAFAEKALQLKWGENAPVTTDDILTARRYEDDSDNLWNVYNTVQENLLKGGLAGCAATGRRTSTRAVRGIDSDVKLNKGLWQLADEFAEV